MLSEMCNDAQNAVYEVLNATLEQRQSASFLKRIKKAGLNPHRSFSNYEWGRFSWPSRLPKDEFCDLHFVRRAENVILYGAPGTGKSHLANAAGIEACRLRMSVVYENTSAFVSRLIEAYQGRRHEDIMKRLNRLDLLILDEFGYVPMDAIGSQLLFRVIGEFYEQKSIIITTNLGFSEWNQIFIDPKLTESIVDRMVHHSHLIQFSGTSYCVEHSLLIS